MQRQDDARTRSYEGPGWACIRPLLAWRVLHIHISRDLGCGLEQYVTVTRAHHKRHVALSHVKSTRHRLNTFESILPAFVSILAILPTPSRYCVHITLHGPDFRVKISRHKATCGCGAGVWKGPCLLHSSSLLSGRRVRVRAHLSPTTTDNGEQITEAHRR